MYVCLCVCLCVCVCVCLRVCVYTYSYTYMHLYVIYNTDINECAQTPSVCPQPAICVNAPGTYECHCAASGYTEDVDGFCVGM